MPDDCTKVEEFVHQQIKRNLGAFRDETSSQTDLCEAMWFSEQVAASLSSFIDSDLTHFSSLSWIKLYLDKVFGPEGDISDTHFPFMGKIANNIPFDQKYNHRGDEEKKKNLIITNYTLADRKDIWIKDETTKRKKEKGKYLTHLKIGPIKWF
jgi:hypothetical protein